MDSETANLLAVAAKSTTPLTVIVLWAVWKFNDFKTSLLIEIREIKTRLTSLEDKRHD